MSIARRHYLFLGSKMSFIVHEIILKCVTFVRCYLNGISISTDGLNFVHVVKFQIKTDLHNLIKLKIQRVL
jgi:hypothetical protein